MSSSTPPKVVFYIPAGEKDKIYALPVVKISAVGHGLLENGGNHWCFYLTVSADTSVRVDISPSYSIPGTTLKGGSKAFIVVSDLSYLLSTSAQKVCEFEIKDSLSVGDFLDVLVNAGRHKYEFNSLGQGCRKWTTDQITLFEERGVFKASEAAAAKDAILTEHPTGRRYPLVFGAYYE